MRSKLLSSFLSSLPLLLSTITMVLPVGDVSAQIFPWKRSSAAVVAPVPTSPESTSSSYSSSSSSSATSSDQALRDSLKIYHPKFGFGVSKKTIDESTESEVEVVFHYDKNFLNKYTPSLFKKVKTNDILQVGDRVLDTDRYSKNEFALGTVTKISSSPTGKVVVTYDLVYEDKKAKPKFNPAEHGFAIEIAPTGMGAPKYTKTTTIGFEKAMSKLLKQVPQYKYCKGFFVCTSEIILQRAKWIEYKTSAPTHFFPGVVNAVFADGSVLVTLFKGQHNLRKVKMVVLSKNEVLEKVSSSGLFFKEVDLAAGERRIFRNLQAGHLNSSSVPKEECLSNGVGSTAIASAASELAATVTEGAESLEMGPTFSSADPAKVTVDPRPSVELNGELVEETAVTAVVTSDTKVLELELELELDTDCVVCMENPREVTFGPCGHNIVCKDCATAIMCKNNLCPNCYNEIESTYYPLEAQEAVAKKQIQLFK